MRKTYQNQEIDTSRPAVPETVTVALAELTEELREGLLALAVALATVRSRIASAKRKTGARTLDQLVAMYSEAELAT